MKNQQQTIIKSGAVMSDSRNMSNLEQWIENFYLKANGKKSIKENGFEVRLTRKNLNMGS